MTDNMDTTFRQISGKKKSLAKMLRIVSGRGGETRTRDTRFWRPVLYQLSYAPKSSYH